MARLKPHYNRRRQKKPGHREKKPRLAAYISRNKAISRLSVTMEQFRRLCILKGVYPRLPTKPPKGMDLKKTWYALADIKALHTDPVLRKIRQIRSHGKHLRRLLSRREYKTAAQVSNTKPVLDLTRTIQERYPTFKDALLALGDCLSMLAMFASYRATTGDRAKATTLARRLALEWDAYVVQTNALVKAFASTKGYFYTARVMGVPVTWCVPHQFTIKHNEAVDFRVLHDFLSFYVVFMKFVNYKLYTSAGLAYPPRIASESGVEFVGTVVLERLAAADTPAPEAPPPEEIPVEVPDLAALDPAPVSEHPVASQLTPDSTAEQPAPLPVSRAESGLFGGLVFFLQPEVPEKAVSFVVRAGGGTIVTDRSNPAITHQVGERDEHLVVVDREFVQPQWLFDCVNESFLLPCAEYVIGATLPPHLSPFVDEANLGYVSERRKQLNAIKENRPYVEEDEEAEDAEAVVDLEAEFVRGLQEETGTAKPARTTEQRAKRSASKKAQELERRRKLNIMSSNDRRVVRSMERRERAKEARVRRMQERLRAAKQKRQQSSETAHKTQAPAE